MENISNNNGENGAENNHNAENIDASIGTKVLDTTKINNGGEKEQNSESIKDLRERFVNDDKYNKYCYSDDDGSRFSYRSIINKLSKGKRDEAEQELMEKLTGDWRPDVIADKYGDEVEKYGISLADVNVLLGFIRPCIENQSSVDMGSSYDFFCRGLPNVIEMHFSDKTPEKEKELMGSIVRKAEQLIADKTYFLYIWGNSSKGPVLSDEESDYIVKKVIETIADDGGHRTVESICHKECHDGIEDIYVDENYYYDNYIIDLLLAGAISIFERCADAEIIHEKIKDKITDESKIKKLLRASEGGTYCYGGELYCTDVVKRHRTISSGDLSMDIGVKYFSHR